MLCTALPIPPMLLREKTGSGAVSFCDGKFLVVPFMKNLFKIMSLSGILFACSGQRNDHNEKELLVYWSLWNKPEPQAQALEQISDEFATLNNGATVKIVFNGRQALVQLRSYLAAQKELDLFDGDGDQFLGLVTKEDLTVDLSDITAGNIYGGTTPFHKAMLPQVIDSMQVENVQYGIPYILNVIAFFYSKQSFEQADINDVPATFENLLQISQQLLDAGIDPIALEGNVSFYHTWYLTSIMQKVAGERYLFDVVMDQSGRSWESSEVKIALEIEKKLIDSGAIPNESSGYQYPAAQNNIAIGKTAMELVGSWLPAELSNAVSPDFRWGVFPFPSVAGGINENKISIAPMTVGIYNRSNNIAKSKDFIRFLLREDSQKKLADLGAVGVPNKSVDWPGALIDVKTMFLNSDGSYLSDGYLSAFLPDFATNILGPTHTKFILGDISVEKFISEMKDKTQKYWRNN